MRHGIKEKDIKDFIKYAEKLRDVLQRINEYNPEANAFLYGESARTLYLFGEDFHLLPKFEIIDSYVADIEMGNFDGGAF